MSHPRGLWFALEVAYLGALAATLALTSLRTPVIVAAMLVGWVLVAAAEWTATRSRPHFAAGLPPAWRVPSVTLPPAQPLEQVVAAYPEASHDEGATWIASAALREELLGGDWPVAVPDETEPEDTQEAFPEEWIVPLPAPVQDTDSAPEIVPGAEPEPEPVPVPVPVLAVVVEERVVAHRSARYHLDPFAEPERGRFGRRTEVPSLEVPARPAGMRPLPGAAAEEDE